MTRRDKFLLFGVALASILVAIVTIVLSTEEFKEAPSSNLFLSIITGFRGFELCRILSVVTGIVSVYLASREIIWVWPIGIVWCMATAWVMFEQRFFGDMALMFVYLILQLHGWHSWKHGSSEHTELPIRWASWRMIGLVVVLVLLGTWPAKEFLELEWVHAKAPLWDSFTTAGSLGAQFLLNRKYIENWIAWIIVDVVFVRMYYVTGLLDYAVLYFVFLLLAVIGLFQWIRIHREQVKCHESS